ncbi:MAG: DUF3097 family protein [Tetrasphaera sp.]|nr:DUF3097 family protein [Tetrasphaera sp.]
MSSRYTSDPLTGDWRRPRRAEVTTVPAELGLVVEETETGWCGAVVRVETIGGAHVVALEDRRGRTRSFPLGPGFLIEGRPVVLARPAPAAAPRTPARSASGSRAVVGARARVAAASRIFVEGTHDAELVEKVWGHDLRVEGVVVEPLHGIDDLAAALADFAPTSSARAGVLVDHLVPGSKESRVVAAATAPYAAAAVLVVGHPFVDVWQAVRPERVGLSAWPVIPRGTDWKAGIAAALGMRHTTTEDIAVVWRHILSRVRTYADLDPAFSGRVEELIDFVTVPPG